MNHKRSLSWKRVLLVFGILLLFIGILAVLCLTVFKKQARSTFVPELKAVNRIDVILQKDTALLKLNILLKNNGFLKMHLTDSLVYDVKIDHTSYATGSKKLDVQLNPNESDTINFPVKLLFADLQKEIRLLQGTDSITYYAYVDLYRKIPFINVIKVPLSFTGKLRVPIPPVFEIVSVEHKLQFPQVKLTVALKITNLNPIKLELKNLKYNLAIGDLLTAKGEKKVDVIIRPKNETFVKIPITITADKIFKAIKKIIMDNDTYNYKIVLESNIKSNYPGLGNTEIKIEKSGKTELVK